MCGVNLTVNRHGQNLFISYLPGSAGSTMVYPSLREEDLCVELGKRAYIKVERYGRWGIRIEIRRMKDHKVLLSERTKKGQIKIKYDPWDHVQSI